MTEKHKLNVPETMTEVLDVSDEEGECVFSVSYLGSPLCVTLYFIKLLGLSTQCYTIVCA